MSECYKFSIPAWDITFEADRLRREKHELIGELTVRCGLPGAQVINGCLSTADFNFSSLRARQDRARHLGDRAKTNGKLDWFGFLEDFCQRVFSAERNGAPACDLRELQRPERGDDISVEGLTFPKRHPAILFGDGGAAKSYTALYLVGRLAERGLSVALFDWELCGEDHRERLEMIFGSNMPKVLYCRCERPLTVEVDQLRRVVRDNKVEYAIYDSIAFACDGRPEEAEVAGRYFRAVREVGCGSLHIAHVNRSDENDKKPFGSSFWHNGARTTWFVQASEQAGDDKSLRLGFFNRKSNLGPLRSPASFVIEFGRDRTLFRRADIADTPELAGKMSVHQRMKHLLKRGSLAPEEIASQIDAEVETVKREARRRRQDFIVLSGGRIGLVG
jgi:hypothetical protein